MSQRKTLVFIDPSYAVFGNDKLFDLSDPILNRDGQLLPIHRSRERLLGAGKIVHTADYLFKNKACDERDCEYYSLGILDNFRRVSLEKSVKLAAFVVMEPPVVAPHLYKALPELTASFDRVYVHNINGDGYSLDGVDASKLHRLYWPIPYDDVLQPYWGNAIRMKRIVVINGSHNPRGRKKELYSVRIKAMVELSRTGIVDLYGIDWNKWWLRKAMWLPYWKNRRTLMAIYNGKCGSKFEVLQNYEYCLCFENMVMDGYITEKLFDCLYAGTIPLYLGAPDILNYVPDDVFVDCRKYSTWSEMWKEVASFSPVKIRDMRNAGREFLKSDMARKFFNSIEYICNGS